MALAKRGESKINLVGFFIIVENGLFPLDREIADKMKEHSERLNLPLIKIEKPDPFKRYFTKKIGLGQ